MIENLNEMSQLKTAMSGLAFDLNEKEGIDFKRLLLKTFENKAREKAGLPLIS